MKLCSITTWPPHRDGIAYYSYDLYKHLSKYMDVNIIANKIDKNNTLYNNDINVKRIWKRNSLLYPLKIFTTLLEQKPDIIHFQHGWLLYGEGIISGLFLALLLLIKLRKIPLITTLHTIIKKDYKISNNKILNILAKSLITFTTKITTRLSDKIIVHNKLMKFILLKEYVTKEYKEKITIIPHGILKSKQKNKLNLKNKDTVILSLGFLRDIKTLNYLLESFKKYICVNEKSKLIIAGGFHAHDKEKIFRKLKSKLKTNLSKVIFTDFLAREKLVQLIARADIITLISFEKKFIETSGTLAMVSDFKKPVICTKIPKFTSELLNGQDCIIVSPDNTNELTKSFIFLSKDIKNREYLSSNLKTKFKNRYWDDVAKEHVKLYNNLMEEYDEYSFHN